MEFETSRIAGGTNRLSRAAFGFAAGLCLCTAAVPARAAEPAWPPGTYKYITIDQSVRDALTEFGRNIHVPVKLSDDVKGRLSAGMPIGTAREFLQWVCDRYGLVWYYDGSSLAIATEAEVRTEMFKVDPQTIRGVPGRLQELGIMDARYPIKITAGENVVSVSGPPAYIDAVRKALGVLAEPSRPIWAREVDGASGNVVPVRVFRGRRAEAENVPAVKHPGENR
jgi:type III secretion protein C